MFQTLEIVSISNLPSGYLNPFLPNFAHCSLHLDFPLEWSIGKTVAGYDDRHKEIEHN